MRWIVEVTSLEGPSVSSPKAGAAASPQSYCVEAETWQTALQAARHLRGDDSRMAGFSIDIINDGCKAVDPAKKLRYEVKRTADDAPLTPGADAVPPSKRRTSVSPPRPAVSAGNGAASTSSPAKPPTSNATKPVAAKPPTPPSADATERMKAPPVHADSKPAAKATPAPAAASTPPIAIPPILVSREQEATAEVQLTYREYGFGFAPGTTEDAAASALMQQLVRIQGALAALPAGKLVNLAAFDQIFQGRPPVLPIATLTWKDWKPEPAIGYPRRTHQKPAAPAIVTAPAAPAVATAPASAPAAPAAAPPPPTPVAAPAAPAPNPVAAIPPPVVVAIEVATGAAEAGPVSQTREKVPVKRRVPGEELISVLFESMHDLNFLRDSIEGGDFCLQLALEKLPSRVALVYLYDIDHREFVIVSAHGVASQGVVGRRVADTESTLANAMRKRRAVLLSPEEIAEHAGTIGGAQHLLVAPVMQAGRFLGAIEMADPSDGVPYSELDANAITYMAEQYAEFVAARGVLLEREQSSAPPAQKT